MPMMIENLPESIDVSSRGQAVTVDVTKLDAGMIVKLAMHGLKQKVSDAAASASKLAEDSEDDAPTIARNLMEAVARRLEAGDWGAERSGGGSTDPMMKWLVMVLRTMMRNNPDGDLKKGYDKIDTKDQPARRKYLETIAENNREKLMPHAEKLKAEDDARKKAEREAVKGLDIDI